MKNFAGMLAFGLLALTSSTHPRPLHDQVGSGVTEMASKNSLGDSVSGLNHTIDKLFEKIEFQEKLVVDSEARVRSAVYSVQQEKSHYHAHCPPLPGGYDFPTNADPYSIDFDLLNKYWNAKKKDKELIMELMTQLKPNGKRSDLEEAVHEDTIDEGAIDEDNGDWDDLDEDEVDEDELDELDDMDGELLTNSKHKDSQTGPLKQEKKQLQHTLKELKTRRQRTMTLGAEIEMYQSSCGEGDTPQGKTRIEKTPAAPASAE
ncbi:hypothetical protein CLAFUW4_00517 [Fulvia fulva]|uniref:Uncharacterized protein n=1 Tax=Passalora fulva TaxID=5499 RepID=A0A9Q8P4D7_PASFU|nr:uncharacterized protein CLAFUR5_00517 [Fulvia fulva]KAK4634922.1 hypothetical protein CLAFUR4_00518 [Fulvia fulva]KAK4636471.1 hypothetical protein CLAFUR0_00519 [Fulvia fulva]UJO12868.1 hypothetical protein CLAFUR5_00517 [Fulvia fulva]WPV09536.1 hypothetical protein CLAFUW4_00517 [Fulvia fulva]WPV25030.1 hypothetical protein CLAFUW7_00522 [Fulvia fulva]